MRRFRDTLSDQDLVHLRRILGEREDPTFSETRRRLRVNRITMDDVFLAEQALAPFQALPQDDRERLMSDIVWHVTCAVEGSITEMPGGIFGLDSGFRLKKLVQDGRDIFCVVKPE